jgi:hypothetical protein
VSLLVALLITTLAFPEVVFLRGSLSSIGLKYAAVDRIRPPVVNVYPEFEGRKAEVGQNDIGARVWQFEPAIKFVNRSIYQGESPEWNPYAASGSLGPETLADMKLSPFVLLVALLGATSGVFSAVMLAFVVAALYCLQQFFIRTLNMSRTAAIAGCAVFLLCGWASNTLISQTSGPYLLLPVVLYTLTEYQRAGGWPRLVAAVATYAGLLATTFVPGILLVLVLVQAVALLLDVSRPPRDRERGLWWRTGHFAGRQALVPVLGLLTAAYVWLPNLSALLNAGSEFDTYQANDLPTKPPLLYLSLLTPRHVFRWYEPDTIPPGIDRPGWTTYVGIASVIIVLAALPRARGVVRRVLILSTALMVLSLAMHVGTPVIRLLGELPGLRPIGWSYWGSLAGAAMVLALACAVETIGRYGMSLKVAAGAALVVAAAFGLALISTGNTSTAVAISLGFSGLVLVAVVVLGWVSVRRPNRRSLVAALCVGLVVVELFSYQNHQRMRRYDYEDHVPAYLSFIRDTVDGGRVYSAGQGALFGEWGSAFDIRMIETINLMQQPWYRTFFLSHVNSGERQNRFLQDGTRDAPFTAEPAALDLLSVRYLLVDTHLDVLEGEIAQQYPLVFEDNGARVNVYANPDAFPRAFLSGALTTPDDRSARPTAPWVVPTAFTDDAALLDEAREKGIPRRADRAEGSAVIVEDHHTRVVVEVDAPSPGVLVLSDSYHSNWGATVNGEQQHVGRVDDIARGVIVPAGRSTVVFRYHSTPRTIGAAISMLTIGGLLTAGVISAVRLRKRRDRHPTGVG